MDQSPNLKLPYIMAAQAQKHVTHNEAIRALDAIVQLSLLDRDLAAPPATPADGDCYAIAAAPTGAWAGQAGRVAAWQDGAWSFLEPRSGWTAWVVDEAQLMVWNGSGWQATGGSESINPTPLVGVNATADTTNRLAVASPAVLLDNAGAGHQLKINKAAAADTASLLFQSGYSGRAEIGLAGDDNCHFKVSADGTSWHEAIVVDRSTGAVAFPNTTLSAGGEANTASNLGSGIGLAMAKAGIDLPFKTLKAGANVSLTDSGSEVTIAAAGGGGAPSVIINVKDAPHGAVGNNVADDTTAIQSALDAAAALGGGIVYLPPGSYKCGNTLAVGSNVHLMGAGFASIIRNTAGAVPGKTLSGKTVYCSIAMVGVANARVSRLTLDQQTNGCTTNGIQIGESLATVRSGDCVVEDCQVLGFNAHHYMIYSKCADRTKIRNNVVTGHTTTTTMDLAGIEVYGGSEIEVASNRLARCGPGIAVVQESITSDSDLAGIDLHDNFIDSCHNGIMLMASAARSTVGVHVHHNTVTNSGNRGIVLGLSTGTCTEVRIGENIVKGGAAGGGIVIDAGGTTPAATSRIAVTGNLVTTSGGILLSGAINTTVEGNHAIANGAANLVVSSSSTVDFVGNVFSGSTGNNIDCSSSSNLLFCGNLLTGHAGSGIASNDAGSSNWTIVENYFKRAGGATEAACINAASVAACRIQGNRLGYKPALQAFAVSSGSISQGTANFSVPGTQLDNVALPAGDLVRFNGAAGAYNLTGIVGGEDGLEIMIQNNSSSILTLYTNNAASSIGNRLSLGPASTIAIPGYANFKLRFSRLDNAWVYLGKSA